MKKTYLALAVAGAAFVATPAIAQDYQMEAGVSYTSISPDVGPSDSAIAVDFTYYLEQVSTAGKPLAEAAFLGRNNNVGLGYETIDKADVDTINLNAEFWFEDIYVAADIDRWDDSSWDEDGIDYEVTAGYMIDDGLLVKASYADSDESGSKATYGLGAKYVADLGGNFVNLEADYKNNDGDSLFAVAGDYFLTNELSIGAGLAQTDVSGSKLQIDVGAKYFFLPTVSGEVSYTHNYENADKDSAINLRLAARF